jgi:Mn-dependent DtxR family transcriptional regulator
MQSNESTEMYLETIHVLHQEKERVQAVDVAKRMGYSKPTISEWMSKLRKLGYVEMDGSNILLTPTGEKIASRVYERHVLLRMLFQSIGVNEETADEDACRVEHYISDETFECLRNHYDAYTAKLQG